MGDFWNLMKSLETDERDHSEKIQPPNHHYIKMIKLLSDLIACYSENLELSNKWNTANQKLIKGAGTEKIKDRHKRDFQRAGMEIAKKNKRQEESVLLILDDARLQNMQFQLDLKLIRQNEEFHSDEDAAFMEEQKIMGEIEETESLKMVIGIAVETEETEIKLLRTQYDFAILQLFEDLRLLNEKKQRDTHNMRLLSQRQLVEQEKLNNMKEEFQLKLLDHYKQCIAELPQPDTCDWSSCSSRSSRSSQSSRSSRSSHQSSNDE